MSTKSRSESRPATTPADQSTSPTLTPEMLVAGPPAEIAGAGGMPALQPPGSEAAGLTAQGLGDGAAATRTAKVAGLWTNNAQSNAWAYLSGVGWRRLGPGSPEGHRALLALARLARDANLDIQCEDDGSVVHNIYVW